MVRIINEDGIGLIKMYEGMELKPYKSPAGDWTIGYGHTVGVDENTPAIDEDTAEELLKEDLSDAEEDIDRYIKVPLNDNQYAALASLVFNLGPAPLQKTLGARINESNFQGAAEEFERWCYIGNQKSDGLLRRRIAERALFEKPV